MVASPLPSTVVSSGLQVSLWGERAAEFFQFQYGFVIRAVIAAAIVAACCGVIGVFLVLRRMSLLGDATGHATLPGVAIAFLITGSKDLPALLLGALVTAVLAALTTAWLARRRDSRPDAAVAISLASFFALGVVLFSVVQRSETGSQAGINSFLFGNATGISTPQLVLLCATSVVVIGFVTLFFRPLSIRTFDQAFAQSAGIRTAVLDIFFIFFVSIAVVVAIECVGVILVSAMLITPASAALFSVQKLNRVCILAALIGALSGFFGVFLSYLQEGFSSGPMIVLVATLIFALAFLFGPKHGLVARRLRRWRDAHG
jgi:manganese/zinc/iron transport system permease protein